MVCGVDLSMKNCIIDLASVGGEIKGRRFFNITNLASLRLNETKIREDWIHKLRIHDVLRSCAYGISILISLLQLLKQVLLVAIIGRNLYTTESR